MTVSNRSKRSNDDDDDQYDELYKTVESNELMELLKINGIVNSLEENLHIIQCHRMKRDTSEYINEILYDIQSKLDVLESSKEFDSTEDDFTNSTDKIGAKCTILNDGKINCSNAIYENEKSWKKSRQQIDLLIQVLKSKINDLKDIRKHLKEHKPKNVTDSDEDIAKVSNEDESFERHLILSTTQRSQKSTTLPNKHPHEQMTTTTERPKLTGSGQNSSTGTHRPMNLTTNHHSSSNENKKLNATANAMQNKKLSTSKIDDATTKTTTIAMATESVKRHEFSTEKPLQRNIEQELETHEHEQQNRAECFCEPDAEK